jgi:hypothetical protein
MLCSFCIFRMLVMSRYPSTFTLLWVTVMKLLPMLYRGAISSRYYIAVLTFPWFIRYRHSNANSERWGATLERASSAHRDTGLISLVFLLNCNKWAILRVLTWCNHIFAKRKQLGITLTKMCWLLGRQCELTTSSKLLAYKVVLKPIWTYGLQLRGTASTSNIEILERFQSKTLNRRTLVCDECASPTRPTHSIGQGRNPTTELSIQRPT